MRNPICLLRSVWRKLTRLENISGHDYVTVEGTPENVHVLTCKVCGHQSVSWSFESLEDQK
jgi:hypothetical protein